ncbi:hypothetical protein [Gudongella sp. DL1XJH-153]|uniref:hypothetical protein n=1 Tax=Gudongella sp. DL1XJH-153 TaxID=3409804 RepID=UPI003BB7D79F
MRDGFKKIFWGILIATFSINLGMLQILPAFVGWMVVASGISVLQEKSVSGDYDRPKIISYIIIGATAVGSLITLFQGAQINQPIMLLFYPVVVMTIELLLFHRLLEAAVQDFKAIDDNQTAKIYTGKDRIFIILMGITLVMVTLSLFLNLQSVGFFAAIIAVITRIYLLAIISSLRKEVWNNQDEREVIDNDSEHSLV